MSTHEQIIAQYEQYLKEHEAWESEKPIKAAAARARKALGELGKLTKVNNARKVENKRILRIEKLEKDKITSQELADKLSELEVKIQGNFDAVSVSLTGFEWANRLVFTNESDV